MCQKVEFDVKYGLAGIRSDIHGGRAGAASRNSFVTQDEGGSDESKLSDILFLENYTSIHMPELGPTSLPLTPGMGYKLEQIEAAGFASYYTVTDQKAVLLVKNLRNRLVVTLPQVRISIYKFLRKDIFLRIKLIYI